MTGAAGVGHNGGPPLTFEPQSGPQRALLRSSIGDIFFGGARGGGKTFGMLLDWLEHALEYGRFATGVFFRKIFKNLEEVIAEAHRIFPHFGGKWQKGSATYVFKTGPAAGARLKFRHLANDADAEAYQGHAYTWVCFEEMTQWATPTAIDMLKGTLRSAYGVPCVFRATGNPGGAGHNWVKARYKIGEFPRGFRPITDSETGEVRIFMPSKLEDNQRLMQNDPTYEAKLRRVGTPALVKAWRFGNWDIVAGGFFDDLWSTDKHVLAPFELPGSWIRRRSFDWGSSKPASLGMWAISDGQQPRVKGRDLPYFPAGSFIRFGEWYVAAKDETGLTKPNVGLRLVNETMGELIAEKTGRFTWNGDVADPSIFTDAGGDSIYTQLSKGAKRKGHILSWNAADNSRVTGWQKVRSHMEATALDDLEAPGLWVFDTCLDFIRTVPVLQSDKQKPDDVDSEGEDHIGDETRYALMSRGATVAAGTAKIRRG